jgi:microcystin-dependent protein
MATPYLGEIRMFGGSFAPVGWAFCAGQLVPISENDALFALIGTTYGGDGQSTFALPDLRGRVPMHVGSGFVIGQVAGTETVTLTSQQLPIHTHSPLFTTSQQSAVPTPSTILASATSSQTFLNIYSTDTTGLVQFSPQTGVPAGGSQPHDNMVPFLAFTFIIALQGVFPSQS